MVLDRVSTQIMLELYSLYRNLDDHYLDVFPSPSRYYSSLSDRKKEDVDALLYQYRMFRPVMMSDSIPVQYLKALYRYRNHPSIDVLFPKPRRRLVCLC